MGFGVFGKELRSGRFLQRLGGFVNRATTAIKPVAGAVTGVIDHFAPGVGSAIKTGVDVVDGISGQLKGAGRDALDSKLGGKMVPKGPVVRSVANLPKVDSVLRNPVQVPKRAPVRRQSSSSGSEEDDEY
jgi:hypothetical protein